MFRTNQIFTTNTFVANLEHLCEQKLAVNCFCQIIKLFAPTITVCYFSNKLSMKNVALHFLCGMFLASASIASAKYKGEEDGLVVTTTFKPNNCDEHRKTQSGDELEMHYVGTIDDSSPTEKRGEKFDSSRDRGESFHFTLGLGQVIQGWDNGLLDMCVGEKRTLVIPAKLGYGDRAMGDDIPAGATLRFEVECLGIHEGKPQPNIFNEIDAKGNADGKLTEEEVAQWFLDEHQREMPDGLFANEDKNGDGSISWDEFGGPKGTEPPKVEL